MSVPTSTALETPERERETSALGMWVFLATEVMFFGPLFINYLHGRIRQHDAYVVASSLLHGWLGTINTALLLTSSLFMALAVRAAQLGNSRAVARLLAVTAAIGIAFLCIKGYEYHGEWEDGLVPGLQFTYGGRDPGGVANFYFLYFAMTGLHALHLAIGIGLVLWLAGRARRGAYDAEHHDAVEVTGLYWHFVDCVWVFLYPLFYLMGYGR